MSYIHSNIKFLRNYTRTTQAEFGRLFGKTRSNIDSYERNVKPDQETQLKIAQHFNVPLEVLLSKDLQMNPGLMYAANSSSEIKSIISEDAIKAKDEIIKELRKQNEYLRSQNENLLKKLKVA